jgi:branched-chain amino acid transport system substrate-binding protein
MLWGSKLFARRRLSLALALLLMGSLLLSACGQSGGSTTTAGGLGNQPATGSTTKSGTTGGEIKIGVLATLNGPLAALGAEGMRGVEQALAEFGGKIGDKKVTIIKESTDATPAVARDAARKLVEQQGVDILIGPLSGDEGLAIRDYAKTKPGKVFLNGNAGSQDMTLRDQATNFYRFNMDGFQWVAGLGTYAYQTQGYKRVAVLAEDYSFPYTQVGGFINEFCKVGGKVTKKFWVPLGTTDYSSIVSSMPTDVDAIFVALGGSDAVNFLKQYDQFGGKAPIIGGSIIIDQTVLTTKGALSQRVLGIASAGPTADNNPDPAWQKYVQMYKAQFADGLPFPSLTSYGYYLNTKAALLALQKVGGDVSGDQAKLKETLNTLTFDTPTGPIKLDQNRNAIHTNYVTVVDKKEDGSLYNKLVKTIPTVNQTLGMPEAEFLKIGPLSRDNPSCNS